MQNRIGDIVSKRYIETFKFYLEEYYSNEASLMRQKEIDQIRKLNQGLEKSKEEIEFLSSQ